MNYIVGLFLNYMTEEDTFWALRQLMENTPYRMSKWFNQELIMVHTSHYQVTIMFICYNRWKSFFRRIFQLYHLIWLILELLLQCIQPRYLVLNSSHIVVYVCLFAFFPIWSGGSCMGYLPCWGLDYCLWSSSRITETLSKWSFREWYDL